MKKRSATVFMVACVTMAAIALCGLLCACNGNNEDAHGPFVPDEFLEEPPQLDIYSQREHIGYQNSLKNISQYKDYYAMGEPAFVIPGLNQGENFVLQGIAYSGEHDIALLAGYVNPSTQNRNSAIFVIDMTQYIKVDENAYLKGVLAKEILLDKADGTAFTGHAGGIAVSKNNVWISNDGKLYYIPIADVLAAPASSHIALKNSISVPVNASYTEYSDGTLWVGEFEYASGNYVTDATHHNAQNKNLTAWTVGYKLDESGTAGYDVATGIKSDNLKDVAIPDIVLWHGQKVQGMTAIDLKNGSLKVLLSTSYGRTKSSQLYTYEIPANEAAPQTVEIAGSSIPCYVLTNGKTITAPPMLEDLAHFEENGQHFVLVASESGSYNYYGAENSKSIYPTDLIWKLKIA